MSKDKCDTCKHEDTDFDCSSCGMITINGKIDLYEPITNADKIRAMSDEELAEMFYGSTTEDDQLCLLGKRPWLEDIYDWLQSEVEE